MLRRQLAALESLLIVLKAIMYYNSNGFPSCCTLIETYNILRRYHICLAKSAHWRVYVHVSSIVTPLVETASEYTMIAASRHFCE